MTEALGLALSPLLWGQPRFLFGAGPPPRIGQPLPVGAVFGFLPGPLLRALFGASALLGGLAIRRFLRALRLCLVQTT